MRPTTVSVRVIAAIAVCGLIATPSLAKRVAHPTAQAAHCAEAAKGQNLTGAPRDAFIKTCVKGPLTPAKPTGPTATSQEAQAVTKPSGADRTTRTKQCATEADRKGLAAKDRKAFQLSCLATAGPVSEGETGTKQPQPANQIKGIGVNNYKPNAAPAKSAPASNPPAAAKPQP